MTIQQNDSGRKRWVREKVAADYLGLSSALLAKDRSRHHLGIPFLRLGRTIMYDLNALDAWMARQVQGEQ